ncbi:glycosyltransferase [Salinibacter ruber]|uniref:Glycosyltransferase involved in cell wall biosynthesis n=1 Tax=Salinibacter ruber TaxID=146919 RepID=A0AAW5P832_9BACT|nr:glycosyltransferase [Salinibacter ruber]MCS4157972.1 glycosyltransferase involved in cell wall biosynthesis [Salinibacter ruber]
MTRHRVFGVVTPSYNKSVYIEDAINSVLLQEYDHIKYSIVDGGSKDGSIEIINTYKKNVDKIIIGKDNGQAHAINIGWNSLDADIYTWINADDKLANNALSIINFYDKKNNKKIYYGKCGIINAKGELIDTKDPKQITKEDLLRGKSLPQPSVYISKEIIDEFGFLDESLEYALDWEYFARIISKIGIKNTCYVPHVLSYSRVYDDTKTRKGLSKIGKERRSVLKNSELDVSKKRLYTYLAETYWTQGTYQILYGDAYEATKSALKATYNRPISVLGKLKKIPWIIRKLYHKNDN